MPYLCPRLRLWRWSSWGWRILFQVHMQRGVVSQLIPASAGALGQGLGSSLRGHLGFLSAGQQDFRATAQEKGGGSCRSLQTWTQELAQCAFHFILWAMSSQSLPGFKGMGLRPPPLNKKSVRPLPTMMNLPGLDRFPFAFSSGCHGNQLIHCCKGCRVSLEDPQRGKHPCLPRALSEPVWVRISFSGPCRAEWAGMLPGGFSSICFPEPLWLQSPALPTPCL